MNLPNKITLARIAFIPLFVVFLLCPIPHGDIWAAFIFAIASVSDAIDGRIARSRGLVTNFGKFADPLADKMLVGAALICLVAMSRLPAWIFVVILCREFAVDGLRLVAAEQGIVIAASKWGKLKTLFQMVMVVMLLLNSLMFWPQPLYSIVSWLVIIIALLLTIWSGYDYLHKGWAYLK
jgi:CDP-diacylglycerol---glycerol-3-phosphate 3-phosphatidyltransferase